MAPRKAGTKTKVKGRKAATATTRRKTVGKKSATAQRASRKAA